MKCFKDSKVSIGTAQFGEKYGVMNQSGRTQINEVSRIIDLARQNKINMIDTAAGYGDSEIILGKLNICDFNVGTKLPSLKNSINDLYSQIRHTISRSLDRLKISKLEYILVHDENDLIRMKNERLIDALLNIKDLGLTKKIGLSIYTPSILDNINRLSDIDIVQSSLNIFDQRMLDHHWVKIFKKHDIEFHARSIFLQGLLLNNWKKIPKYFDPWKENFNMWHDYANDSGRSKLSNILGWINGIDSVARFIIGVETCNQLNDILKVQKQSFNSRCDLNMNKFSLSDKRLINPSNWKIG